MRYAATYSFNVRRYVRHEFEAESPEQAERIAKAEAWPQIDAEVERLTNGDGFADAAEYDSYLMLDRINGEGMIEEEIAAETIPDPTDEEVAAQVAARG